MSVTRFDPFADPFRHFDRLTNQLVSGQRTPMGMPMDVWRADDGYHVALDLPGVDPAQVDITAEHSTLTIRAERTPDYEKEQEVLVAERPQGSFTRQLQIGDGLDLESVRAEYSDGVLRMVIPVTTAAKARRVEVEHRSTPSSTQQVKSGEDPQS
jgi:HSP20 family protein